MKYFKSLALFGALALWSATGSSAVDVEEEDDVLVLTDAIFEEAIPQYENVLVEFYAPWCGHCKSLAPEYAKAAKELKETHENIRLAKVDVTANSEVGKKYDVQGFPTLKLFKGDVDPSLVVEFDGGRTSDEIVKWLVKKTGPSVTLVDGADALADIKEANDVVVVALLESLEDENSEIFTKVADLDDSVIFVPTTDKSLVAEEISAPGVVLYKKFDEGKVIYDGEFTKAGLLEFVSGNKLPLVMEFSQEKAPQIFGGDIKTHVLLFADTSKEYHAKLVEDAKVASKENKGKMLHIVIPTSENRILDYFGLKEEQLPSVVLADMAGAMKKYFFEKEGDDLEAVIGSTFAEDLKTWEASYLSGELKPLLKSAEPADDSDEAVKVIVGKDFKERVVDSDKDVLLEFYAPWCGHCKSLAPKYEELAEQFSSVDSIMIAKMDATENEIDHPGVDVQGFPTIIFFPAGDKQNPVVYDGARDVKGMAEYLKEHAKKFDLDGESHGKDHDEL